MRVRACGWRGGGRRRVGGRGCRRRWPRHTSAASSLRGRRTGSANGPRSSRLKVAMRRLPDSTATGDMPASASAGGWIAGAVVVDLGDQAGGAQAGFGSRNSARKSFPSGGMNRALDLARQEADLLDQRRERLDEREHDRPPRLGLGLPAVACRGAAEPLEQCSGLRPAAVGVAREERLESLLAEPLGIGCHGARCRRAGHRWSAQH